MATFGGRLRLLREEKDMAQKELAAVLKVSQSAVGKYENDQRTPSPTAIVKLAVLFDVSTDYLLGHSDIRNPLQTEYPGLPEEAVKEIETFKEFMKYKYGNLK
jgi:transcriptional regulator with XRE-family HTH domain